MPDLATDTPVINVPLLRKTLEHITAHPEEWDQGVWMREAARNECGTAGCLAGWALTLAGHELDFDKNNIFFGEAHYLTDGRPIEEAAEQELGLTEDQGEELFAETNTLVDLWELANEYTDGEIEVPETL